MSNLFFSFDPMVIITTVRTTVLRLVLALWSEPLGVSIIMDSCSDLLTNPTVTRVVTRSTQTVISSSSDLSTSFLATTLTTRGGAETITSSSLITPPTTLPSDNIPTNVYYLRSQCKWLGCGYRLCSLISCTPDNLCGSCWILEYRWAHGIVELDRNYVTFRGQLL